MTFHPYKGLGVMRIKNWFSASRGKKLVLQVKTKTYTTK